jgi:hypothetical protein
MSEKVVVHVVYGLRCNIPDSVDEGGLYKVMCSYEVSTDEDAHELARALNEAYGWDEFTIFSTREEALQYVQECQEEQCHQGPLP